jgi:hypothetical protein
MRFYALVAAAFATAFLGALLVIGGLPPVFKFWAHAKPAETTMLSEIERERLRLYPEALKPPPANTKRSKTEAASLETLEEQEVQFARYGRDSQRKSAMKHLQQPLGYFCGDQHRKEMISGITDYYYHRLNSIERKYDWAGPAAARYIIQRYETPEDRQIDSALREAVARGYIKVADFGQYERRLIGRIVQAEKVTGRGC